MKPSLVVLPLLVGLSGCAGGAADQAEPSPTVEASASGPGSAASKDSVGTAPRARWRVETLAEGLDHPWGLIELPEGSALFTERSGGISLLADGEVTQVVDGPEDLYAAGEGGLMGIELSPDFAQDRRIFACYASTAGDVRIVPWRLARDGTSATRLDPLVTGLTLASSGRHSGCRLRIGADEMLWIGAGDSASGTNPQDLSALGGKVLRVDPATGQAPRDNPYATDNDPDTRLVWSYGHRNPQGLAVRPDSDQMYASEHGPDVDDEVNQLTRGGNYGWDPVGSGEYNESVPMTDTSIDGAVAAVWSSGDPTLAVSGIAFLSEEWGASSGRLAIATLKGSALYLLDVQTGKLTKAPVLDGDHGRLRAVEPSADGSFYVLTDNGDDEILRVSP